MGEVYWVQGFCGAGVVPASTGRASCVSGVGCGKLLQTLRVVDAIGRDALQVMGGGEGSGVTGGHVNDVRVKSGG